jgi:hypothetical protein
MAQLQMLFGVPFLKSFQGPSLPQLLPQNKPIFVVCAPY